MRGSENVYRNPLKEPVRNIYKLTHKKTQKQLMQLMGYAFTSNMSIIHLMASEICLFQSYFYVNLPILDSTYLGSHQEYYPHI